eukprot:5817041-Karenia_brevis.AAC.1
MRICHKVRNPVHKYIDDSGVCPVCRTVLGSRAKVIAHASEKRCRGKKRLTCNEILLHGGVPEIEADVL